MAIDHSKAEDCLKLNVWRRNGTQAGDKLLVLLYIHGGELILENLADLKP